MSETPNIVYGRLLESAHISGYGFERMTRELELLLAGEDWKVVGPGFSDVNAFLKSIDLSAFNIKDRSKLHNRIKELQPKASTRAIGQMTGTPQRTVADHLTGKVNERNRSNRGSDDTYDQQQNTTPERNRSAQPPSALQRSAGEVAKHADTAARKDKAAAQTKAKREASRTAGPLPDGMDLRHGDAREVLADIEPESVALVLTDPPYGDEAEPLYQWLAEWAAKALIPGGSLICYTGQSRLNRDMRILDSHLRYWWTLAMMHDQSQRLAGKFVIAGYKPVLWYVKENRRGRTLVPDVLKPPARDKDLHNWAQGEGGVSALIEHLAEPGELVADPFAGTGTWGKCGEETIHRDHRRGYESASALGQIVWREGPKKMSAADIDLATLKLLSNGQRLLRLNEQKQPDHSLGWSQGQICGNPDPDAPVKHDGRVDGWVHHACATNEEADA
jgi:hypothetical protein